MPRKGQRTSERNLESPKSKAQIAQLCPVDSSVSEVDPGHANDSRMQPLISKHKQKELHK